MASVISCTKCSAALPWDFRASPVAGPCPACNAELQVDVFPALFVQPAQFVRAEAVMEGMEAACFFHAEKKAVVPCGHCGRFLCALCDVELGGEHLCPPCVEASRKKRAPEKWETRRVLYDSISLYLAATPLTFVLIALTVVTAPAAVFLAIFTWKKPSSLIPRTKIRAVLAIIFGVAQIIGLGLYAYYVWSGIRHA